MTEQNRPQARGKRRSDDAGPNQNIADCEAERGAAPDTANQGNRGEMALKRSVLIVDPLDESREVLRTALERRGLRIFEASRAEQGLKLAEELNPDLIVLDLELEIGAPSITDGLEKQSRVHNKPIILLGGARRRSPKHPGAQFIAKPYHYRPLIRKIEQLIAASQPPAAKAG